MYMFVPNTQKADKIQGRAFELPYGANAEFSQTMVALNVKEIDAISVEISLLNLNHF